MRPILKSDLPLTDVTPNIGTMILDNRDRYGGMNAVAQDEGGSFVTWTWNELADDICTFACYLQSKGLRAGDHIGIISRNSYRRLVVELAVMAGGYVSVPIFDRYPEEMTTRLLAFSDVQMLILINDRHLASMPVENTHLLVLETPELPRRELPRREFPRREVPFAHRVDVFDDVMRDTSVTPAQRLEIEHSFRAIDPSDLCLIMFTSGTTQFPKGVMLTHGNLMSQQSALKALWKPEPGMRFLSYLPWHHSFGGLFERFFALHSGGCLAVDDSRGKDIDILLRNCAIIRPHIYFSVPKVYKEIIARVLVSREAEESFFHDDLKFIFTAAAPLDLGVSDMITKKGIPVVEGWGLTETSPCCTLTDLLLDREPGVVGVPIPGVEIALGDENEILVRGVNVMKGYYGLEEATASVLDEEGWFKTGDLGSVSEAGVRITGRKDRVFKLSNGEKVFPSVIERNIGAICRFIKHAYVFGAGQDHPYALLFPNRELLASRETGARDESECRHPCDPDALKACLSRCIHTINCHEDVTFEHIEKALLIDEELTIERGELTPSFKIIPRNIETNYRSHIACMLDGSVDRLPPNAYVVEVCDWREHGGEQPAPCVDHDNP